MPPTRHDCSNFAPTQAIRPHATARSRTWIYRRMGSVSTDLIDRPRIAHEVALELRDIYGARLRDVVLYGSSARGDAQPDSHIELLVVLDEVPSRRRELARMSDVLWRHSLSNDVVLSEIPISVSEYQDHRVPLLEEGTCRGRLCSVSKDRGEALIARGDTEFARRASPRGGRLLGPGNLPRLLCRLLCGGGCALEPWRDSLQAFRGTVSLWANRSQAGWL